MEPPAFNGLGTRALDRMIACPAQRVVELMVVAFAIGRIIKHVKCIVWKRSMARLPKEGCTASGTDSILDSVTYMTPKAINVPFALQFAIQSRYRLLFDRLVAGTTLW